MRIKKIISIRLLKTLEKFFVHFCKQIFIFFYKQARTKTFRNK